MCQRLVDRIRKAVPVNLIVAVTVVYVVQGAESPPRTLSPRNDAFHSNNEVNGV